MTLQYKIEMLQPEDAPSDDSAFIHTKIDLPAYQNRIGKEGYGNLDVADKSAFMTGLFNIDGVTEASSKAFRLWIMKAPSFQWIDILPTVVDYIASEVGESGSDALPGSAKLDGTGLRLDSSNNRRLI